MISLNQTESRVLAALAAVGSSGDWGFGYLSFRAIAHAVPRLPRSHIRRACRSLARKGLAQYANGLWSEDGEPRGSGYAATKTGRAKADAVLVDKIVARMGYD